MDTVSAPPTRAAIAAELLYRAQHKLEFFYLDAGPPRGDAVVKHWPVLKRAQVSRNAALWQQTA